MSGGVQGPPEGALYGAQALKFFDELERADPGNKTCVDCNANRPLWGSLSYGTYFCLECSGVHRSLGVHISFVRSLNMDSWNDKHQAKMRRGGNTALRAYLRKCGMPESYNNDGNTQSIKDKYHTKSMEAYRDHMAALDRGEPSTLVPVPWEVVAVVAAPERKMSGFGSAPPPPADNGMAGLDSLMSGLSSLKSKAAEKASAAKEAAKGYAKESAVLGSVVEKASIVTDFAKNKIDRATTFDAMSDLKHLRDPSSGGGEGAGGGGGDDEAFGGFDGFDVDVDLAKEKLANAASTAKETAKETVGWLWGAASSRLEKATTFDAMSDLAHLRKANDAAAASAAHDAGASSSGGGASADGWGGWEEDELNAALAEPDPVAKVPAHAGARSGGGGASADGWGGWEEDELNAALAEPDPVPMAKHPNVAKAAAPASSSVSAVAAAAADGWGDDADGWGEDIDISDGPSAIKSAATPVAAPPAPAAKPTKVAATRGASADGWGDDDEW